MVSEGVEWLRLPRLQTESEEVVVAVVVGVVVADVGCGRRLATGTTRQRRTGRDATEAGCQWKKRRRRRRRCLKSWSQRHSI